MIWLAIVSAVVVLNVLVGRAHSRHLDRMEQIHRDRFRLFLMKLGEMTDGGSPVPDPENKPRSSFGETPEH
jgi:hypothetical protein